MSSPRRFFLPLLVVLALAGLAVGVSACGYESHETEVSEGHVFELGELEFKATFSRYLNPNDNEDSAYLVGQENPAPDGETYFGVFFEVQNDTDETQTLPETFWIIDADGQRYNVLPSESLYAFPFGGEVEEHEQIPILDSTPDLGPIEGSMALFLLPEAANENRPLILHVPGPDGEEAEVTLDL
jgi:hypothetical protein